MFKSYLFTLGLVVIFFCSIHAQESEIRHDGIVLPNMTAVEMMSITSPNEGHTIYNSDSNSIWYYNGLTWINLNFIPIGTSPFEVDGSTIRQKGGYAIDDFIIGRDALPDNSFITDKFFFFDKLTGAMRGGELYSSDQWKQSNLGVGSFGWGLDVLASGDYSSIALGHSAEATGNYGATAIGSFTQANGDNGSLALGSHVSAYGKFGSTAVGYNNQARGNDGAIAIGHGLRAYGNSGTVVGTFNDPLVSIEEPLSKASPVFIVGNGDATTRSNALVVYKDGSTRLKGPLSVESSAQIDGVLHVKDILFVSKDAILNQNAQISGNVAVTGTIDVFSGLQVTGDAVMNSNVDISGDTNMTGHLRVLDNATFEDLSFMNEGVKFKATAAPGLCNSITDGIVYYNAAVKKLKFCDGSNWVNLH